MDWISSRARLSGRKTALIDIETNRSLTFKELNERANRWAQFLRERDIQKGDRIACLLMNQIDVFELIFACAKIGAIFVPLNWRLSSNELSYILKDASPKLLIYHSEFSVTAKELKEEWFSLISLAEFDIDAIPELSVNEAVSELDPWFIIYTGGTTGLPKGVVLAHRSVDWNAYNTIVSWGLTGEEITLTYMPIFHTGGLNALSLPILMNGGTVVVGNKFDPKEALYYLKKYRCTIALFVPTMHHMMQQTKEFEQWNFPDMKVFLSGGAPCPLVIYEKYAQKGLRFKEGYGLTEAGPNNFFITPEDAMVKRGSVGKPMMFNEVKIVGFDGKEVGANEVGELLVRGNHSFLEYWNNKEATSSTWINGWIHTGDLAKRDEDGYYYIVGRKKDMIISGGENVYPLEIEQVLVEHPSINEAAVVGVPDEKWGEKVIAYVSLKNGSSISDQELKEFCTGKIAKYKVPKSFVFLDEIPKTHVGKIDKKALTTLYKS